MQAAAIPFLKNLMGNKNLRTYARRGVKLGAKVAIRAIQQRRRRKGRAQLVRTVGRASIGGVTKKQSLAPVRMNETRFATRPDQPVHDNCVSTLSIPISQTSLGVAAVWPISASDSVMFPNLTINSENYSYYDFSTLTFRYVPTVGTSFTGNIALAFTNDMNVDGSNVQDYDTACGFPQRCTGQVSAPLAITVNYAQMNHGYSQNGLVIDNAYADTPSLPNYYSGNLIAATSNIVLDGAAVPAGTEIGRIEVSFVGCLRAMKLPEVKAATAEFDSTGVLPVALTRGTNVRMLPCYDANGVGYTDRFVYYCRTRSVLMLHYEQLHGGTPLTPVVKFNTVTQTAEETYTSASSDDAFVQVFVMPVSRGVLVQLNAAGTPSANPTFRMVFIPRDSGWAFDE